jgi:hypothetical protein
MIFIGHLRFFFWVWRLIFDLFPLFLLTPLYLYSSQYYHSLPHTHLCVREYKNTYKKQLLLVVCS